MALVSPQFAQSEQGREKINKWGMEAWRNAYEEKRQEERVNNE